MRILITLIALCCFSASGLTQIKFFKLFTNNGVDRGAGAVQLEDSSYVLTGSSSSFFDGAAQAFLLHIDSMGNYLWSKDYGGPEVDGGRRVLYKKNFGYFICGYTNSYGNGGFDMYLIKVKENADKEWGKTFGGTGWEQVHDAALTKDTGVLLVGETSSNPTDNKDIYLVRTDKFGDTIWTKTIGGTGDDYATSIAQYNDSLFIVAGRRWNEDSLMSKAWFMYLKDDGTVLWEKTFGQFGDYWINDVTVDGSRFVGVGGTMAPFKDGIDFYFCPLDFNGNIIGPFEWPVPGDEDLMCITRYGSSNDFYVAAHREDAGSYEGGPDMLIHKFQNSFAWVNGFGVAHVDPDIIGELIPTSDGGAFTVGYTTGVISGGNEIFALKIGPSDLYPDTDLDVVVDAIVSVESNEEIEHVSIYPNPAHNVLNIDVEEGEFNELYVFDCNGRILLNESLSTSKALDVSAFPDGIYFLELKNSEGKTAHYKVMVRR